MVTATRTINQSTSHRPVSAKWRKLFQDHLQGYDPLAVNDGGWFDARAADLACDFFRDCIKHVKGELAGKPFILEPWQRAIVGSIFGWKRPDGTRRYREVFIFVPRKNGKTTLVAGLIHLVAFTDNEPGAELYSAAADRDQARLVFAQAKGMIHHEPELSSRAQIYTNAIVYPDNVSYKAVSAEAGTKHGYNTHLAIIDELHAQPNRELVDVLQTSTGSRRQPLLIFITTSDYDREGSICNEKHDYAGKVRDGILEDNSLLPVIYEATSKDDWTDAKTWAKANPNLGVSVSWEYIEHECKRAQESPVYENTFKRLHLNIRTEQDVRWLQMAKWDQCGGDIDPLKLLGRPCFAGLDLASTTDISALVLLFPEDGNAVLPFFWIPKDTAHERERRDRVPYLTWAREGLIEMTPGNSTDQEFIEHRIIELRAQYDMKQIAVDRWQAQYIMTNLQKHKIEVVPFGQGYQSMSGPTKELERLVLDGDLNHGGHPVMRWMASNVAVEMDPAGNYKPNKKKSSEKIDGIVALIEALGISMLNEQTESVYSTRGILAL